MAYPYNFCYSSEGLNLTFLRLSGQTDELYTLIVAGFVFLSICLILQTDHWEHQKHFSIRS